MAPGPGVGVTLGAAVGVAGSGRAVLEMALLPAAQQQEVASDELRVSLRSETEERVEKELRTPSMSRMAPRRSQRLWILPWSVGAAGVGRVCSRRLGEGSRCQRWSSYFGRRLGASSVAEIQFGCRVRREVSAPRRGQLGATRGGRVRVAAGGRPIQRSRDGQPFERIEAGAIAAAPGEIEEERAAGAIAEPLAVGAQKVEDAAEDSGFGAETCPRD